MVGSQYQLAQINVARMRAPLDSPTMEDFAARLDDINALADRSPGFVWRLQAYDGDATAVRLWEDDLILVNMSVWESIEELRSYAYGGAHLEVMRRRKEWFERLAGAFVALWWVPRGHIPTIDEGRDHLDHLRAHGPSPRAFTFARPFNAPDRARTAALGPA